MAHSDVPQEMLDPFRGHSLDIELTRVHSSGPDDIFPKAIGKLLRVAVVISVGVGRNLFERS